MAAVAVAVVLLALGRAGVCPWPSLCGRVEAVDVAQTRLDTAVPAPKGSLVIEQSFTPQHDGLTSVELLLLRYDGQPAAGAHFDVALLDDTGAPVAAESLPVAGLSHNQSYSLTFPPQRASAGRPYTVRLSGSDDNPPTDITEYLVGMELNDPINANHRDASGFFNNTGEYAGSYHVGGAHFLMTDGAVRFVSQNINMNLYQGISTRSKGEVTGEF